MNSNLTPSCLSSGCTCVVCGGESVGKTQLLASLTGRRAITENFRGSTVAWETYRDGDLQWTDTPSIVHESETTATRSTFEQINEADTPEPASFETQTA